jgi:hypothetical protein
MIAPAALCRPKRSPAKITPSATAITGFTYA